MPGDILLLGAGSYPAFTVSRSGTAGQPIVIRGESVDTVTIGGRVTMNDRQYVHLEDVTVMGEVRMNGASNTVVRGCRIRTTAGGITFEIGNAVPRNNTIVDNDVVGGATWVDDQLSADGYNGGEGIQFTGSGHVICFNHVANFRDDISFMEYDEAFEQTSIDICNNDIEQATDDAIEADSAMGNVRVFRNRIRNCFDGISAQPNLGGPTYYVRNVMFNVLYTPFKFHNGTVGDVVVHNTAVKCGDALGIYAGEPWRRALFRNNVFIGGMGGGTYGGYGNGSGRIFDLSDADASCSFDYDGLGSIGTNTFQGRIGAATFNSFATLTANTSEAHAVMVDLGIFATPPAFPANPYPPKPVADLRLAAGSAAVDKGVVIAGPRRRLRRQRARSRRLRAGRAAADLRPAHRRRRHRHGRRRGQRRGRRGERNGRVSGWRHRRRRGGPVDGRSWWWRRQRLRGRRRVRRDRGHRQRLWLRERGRDRRRRIRPAGGGGGGRRPRLAPAQASLTAFLDRGGPG